MADLSSFLRRAALLVVIAALSAAPGESLRADTPSRGGEAGQATAHGENAAGLEIEEVVVGIAGYYEVGRWTPVAVRLRVAAPRQVRLVIEAIDPEGSMAAFPSPIASLDAGSNTLNGLFLQGRLNPGRVWIALEDETGHTLFRGELGRDIRATMHPPLTPGTSMIATLGRPSGFDSPREHGAEAAGEQRVLHLDDAAGLPTDADGWEALDTLVLSGRFALGPGRAPALREWVRGGGHLFIAAGNSVREYLESGLSDWAPVTVAPAPVRLRDLSGLETFTDAHVRLTSPAGIPAARIEAFEGVALAPGPQGPLLVQSPAGFGRVTFLALDLDDPAVAQWEELPKLVQKVLGGAASTPAAAAGVRRAGRLGHSGIGDLATQLRASQDHFPLVRRFSMWGVMGLMLLYLLVIGPADYLLVSHVLKRPQWTWATFPLIVLGAAALAMWGAAATNGESVRTNRLDVVDFDVTSGTARTYSWATILSPRTERYAVELPALELQPGSAELKSVSAADGLANGRRESPRIGWSGIPEAVAGGMYRTGGFEMVRPAYRFAPDSRGIENLPLTTWGTRALASHRNWEGAELVESNLRDAGLGLLDGSFAHHLPGPIEDWLVAYRNRVYHPGSSPERKGATALAPGVNWRPGGANVASRELRGFLTATVSVAIEGRDVLSSRQTPYDPLERDPLAVIRMLTFHRAAGGSDYTGLENQLLGDLELTDALDHGRAVLLGRLRIPAPRTLVNGAPVTDEHQVVIVRLVLPVAPRDDGAPFVPTASVSDESAALGKTRP